MRRFTFVSLIVSLYILSSTMVNASDQLHIIFSDGTSQTVNLNKPAQSIKASISGGDPTASSQNAIAVVAGTYGGNCGASYGNKTEYLASACNNRTQCEYIIDYRVIGDPVFGCAKDYKAEWRCGNDATTHQTSASPEAGFNKKIALSCPR